MLPRKKRVNKTVFTTIIAKGLYAQSPHFTLRYIKGEKDTGSSFSFVASKKIAKTAVKRNSLRRRGYSALSEVWPAKAKSCITGLVFIKNGTESMNFSEYKEELTQLLKKVD